MKTHPLARIPVWLLPPQRWGERREKRAEWLEPFQGGCKPRKMRLDGVIYPSCAEAARATGLERNSIYKLINDSV